MGEVTHAQACPKRLLKLWYLLKRGTTCNEQETTWNDLKQPTTSKKRPETTCNEQETTWNDQQRARNDLKRPTTTWKDLQETRSDLETIYDEEEMTWNDPQRVRHNLQRPKPTYNEQKKEAKQPTTTRIWDYFTWGNRFSSLTRFQPWNDLQRARNALKRPTTSKKQPETMEVEHQTFLYYHMYLLPEIKFTGYVANFFDTRKWTFTRQKSTLWIKQKKSNFDIDKTFRALKMSTWSFSAHHTKNDWMLIILCFSRD